MIEKETLETLIKNYDIDFHDLKILPFCHTTDWKTFANDIVPNQKLIALNPIPGYTKKILCFFYGKAQYAPSRDMEDKFKKHPPITFIFSKENLTIPITRMLPFDSGAFMDKRYGDDLPPLADFECNNPTDEIFIKYKKIFFGDSDNYIDMKLMLCIKPEDYPLNMILFELHRMHESFKAGNAEKYGEQAFTIEVHFEEVELELNPILVLAPKSKLTSEAGIERVKKSVPNSNVITYDDNCSQSDRYSRMRDEAKVQCKKHIL